jgi:hypothetical protein
MLSGASLRGWNARSMVLTRNATGEARDVNGTVVADSPARTRDECYTGLSATYSIEASLTDAGLGTKSPI